MNREWTTEDELRHENRRLASEVAELRVRAEAAEAWCESWKRGAGISSRERDEARADLRDLSEAVKAAWHQCNSAGLNREQYATLHRAFEIAAARQVG
jgi:uncharacterized protein YgfB (UPF0149 family)